MSQLLSDDEINSLLVAFDEPLADDAFSRPRRRIRESKATIGTTLADIARKNTVAKKVSKEPDYLHVTLIQGVTYFSSPGSTVLHPEHHARGIFNFSKIRGFIRSK